MRHRLSFWYYFLSIVTAPGVMLHELGHAIFCVLANVKIHRIKLFQIGKAEAGFVIHDEPKTVYGSVLVCFGPLFLNSLVALLCFSQLHFTVDPWISLLLLWLGFVLALHSIPSTGDAATLTETISRKVRRNPLVILGYPFAGVIFLLNILKRWHIHFLYAFLLIWLGAAYLK